MQESHSQAYINCYVKWPFILYSLLRMQVLVWALCGNDIEKRTGRHICKYVVMCCSCLFLTPLFEYNMLAHIHKPPLFSRHQLYIFYWTKEYSPSFAADKCRADTPSYFLNMFVWKSKPLAVFSMIITLQNHNRVREAQAFLLLISQGFSCKPNQDIDDEPSSLGKRLKRLLLWNGIMSSEAETQMWLFIPVSQVMLFIQMEGTDLENFPSCLPLCNSSCSCFFLNGSLQDVCLTAWTQLKFHQDSFFSSCSSLSPVLATATLVNQ